MPNLHALFPASGFGTVGLVLVSTAVFLAVAVIGEKQGSEPRLLLAISVTCLVSYYIFLHDVSVLALPILMVLEAATAQRNWRRWTMIAAVPPLFAVLWFASDYFYLGALFTFAFLVIQAVSLLAAEKTSRPRLIESS